MTTKAEMLARLSDIDSRRMAEFMRGPAGRPWGEISAAMTDAVTTDDISTLHEATAMLDELGQTVVSLVQDIWPEFSMGTRCSVCGRTAKQNAAIGYNCTEEC